MAFVAEQPDTENSHGRIGFTICSSSDGDEFDQADSGSIFDTS